MKVTRAHGLVLLLAGLAIVVLAIASSRQALTARRDASEDLAQLRIVLDSARAALATSANAADSAKLAAEITEREYYLGRREFHDAAPMPSGAPWRRPFGMSTAFFGVGILLLSGGAIVARNARHTA